MSRIQIWAEPTVHATQIRFVMQTSIPYEDDKRRELAALAAAKAALGELEKVERMDAATVAVNHARIQEILAGFMATPNPFSL